MAHDPDFSNPGLRHAGPGASDSLPPAPGIAHGLAAVARTSERFCEAELHRLQGEAIMATDGDASAASTALRTAVNVATRQGASLFALRSAVRLVQVAGGEDGHRDLLFAARGNLPRNSSLAEASEADALLATATEPGTASRA